MNDVDKLQKLYIFKAVPRLSLEELVALAPPVQFAKDVIVFHQGAPTDVALLLIEGRLVATVEAGGEHQQVGDIRAGEIVGEQGLFLPGGRRSATVTTAEACTALLLSPKVMDHAASNPAIITLEQQLLGTMARRIRKTNQAIQQVWKSDTSGATTSATANRSAEPTTLRQRLANLFGGR
jgi:CRP-like cAMP-binding protein